MINGLQHIDIDTVDYRMAPIGFVAIFVIVVQFVSAQNGIVDFATMTRRMTVEETLRNDAGGLWLWLYGLRNGNSNQC